MHVVRCFCYLPLSWSIWINFARYDEKIIFNQVIYLTYASTEFVYMFSRNKIELLGSISSYILSSNLGFKLLRRSLLWKWQSFSLSLYLNYLIFTIFFGSIVVMVMHCKCSCRHSKFSIASFVHFIASELYILIHHIFVLFIAFKKHLRKCYLT